MEVLVSILAGVRVLEVSQMSFVPSAAAVLADWGAEVVKVEHPVRGDLQRGSTINKVPPDGWRDGFVMMWENANRGKRSIGIDLAQPQGRQLLDELIDTADVFLTNFLPDARRKLRIEPADVQGRNPNVVYARGSGYGARGPKAEAAGYDLVCFWHSTGISHELTAPGAEQPTAMPGPAFGDYTAGMAFAGGIAAALYHRERTGHAAVVDVSLLSAGLWSTQASLVGADLVRQEAMPRIPRDEMANPLTQTYRTADGRFIALCMLQADKYWASFCETIGHPELSTDTRLADMRARAANAAYCVEQLDKVFAERTFEDWKQSLARQEGPWAGVQTPGEAMRDEQAAANGYVQDVDYGGGRVARLVASPVQFDERPVILNPAPAIGEHTDEVLQELGKGWDEIVQLKIDGSIS
jgi:crotonobetainyl-CoA:carnitine CoA-transferase CaiB-like acyl-CoA transferase